MLIISFRKYCGSTHHSIVTIDHKEIKEWVDDKSGKPALIKDGDNADIRIDFSTKDGGRKLKQISWEEWFKIFEKHAFAFQYKKNNGEALNESYRLIKRSI